MAFKPRLLVENFYSQTQFPKHVVSAEEEAAGNEAFRVGNGRRSELDFWTSTTANSDTWIKVNCDRVRAADMLVLDRGHNLSGAAVRVEASQNDFGSAETAADVTLPSTSAPGGPDDPFGVLSEEGAWLIRFPQRAATAWRVFVPAMGVGLKPQLVGVSLGTSWQPRVFEGAWDEDAQESLFTLADTEAGWQAAGRVATRRRGQVRIRLDTDLDYDQARYHLVGHFAKRRPMWMVFDDLQGDRAQLVVPPPGQSGFAIPAPQHQRRGTIAYVEHEVRPT